jgi:hypothetical protein
MSSFDLLILPLVRTNGQEQIEIPGLYTAKAPRRAARGRDRDQLVLYLALASGSLASLERLDSLLAGLANTFYRTSGTVTTALRAVAESANQLFLDRNLRGGNTGSQVTGMLTQIVLRFDRLYLAQSGPAHAFSITSQGIQHYFDPQLSGRGLGLTRTVNIRFSQVDLLANDAVVLTADPPARWTTAMLQGSQGQGPESVRRRLLSQAGPDLGAVLLQAQPGEGQIRLLRPAQQQRPRIATTIVEAEPEPRPERIEQAWETPAVNLEPTSEPIPAEGLQEEFPANNVEHITVSLRREAYPERDELVHPADLTQPEQLAVSPPRKRWTGLSFIGKVFAGIGRAFAGAAADVLRTIALLAKRMLPDESIFTLPASTMAFIAIAIPLLVVTVSSAVYFQRGRAAQYQVYFEQAKEAASAALAEEEPKSLRQAWGTTLALLDQAESFQTTDDSKILRAQAQGALDQLDYIERLDFQPALIDSLKENAHITRMVATDADLYMLNAREGVVLRAILTNDGYRLDPTFQCGPGPQGGIIVGSIKDITAFPKGGDSRATILGIDASGNLLYCIPGDAPLAVSMAAPDSNWGSTEAVTYDTDDLYLLDPPSNAVWIYRRMAVQEEPRLYFGDQIPPMQDVVDMAVNLNDLYLLHTDGHLTTCVFSGLLESPTRCQDPADYADPRPGRPSGPLIENAYFTEITFAPPPDPSLYLLEPNSHAIYHLSVRLTLQRQYRPLEPLTEGPATAFAISRGNRTAFLAVGNQIFYAAMP